MRWSNWGVTCCTIVLSLGFCAGPILAQNPEPLVIPDANLKAAIMDALGIWWEPTEEDLMWVTTLYFELAETPERPTLWITDLTGLEAAVSLRSLNLRYHHVTDLSPLQNLTQLVKLDLSENELSDLSGLAALTQLGILDVHHNGVTDLTPLSGLRQLWSLTLRDNDYQGSLSALSSLTLLQHLDLEHNRIQELDDLGRLTRLTDLRLSYNEITDVSPLANMTELETLDLRHNLLNSVSALTDLTHLKKLFLEGNPLDSQALIDLQTIKDNNPGIDIDYDLPVQPTRYFVDDNAPADPLPGDISASDALEDGSENHPFDSIQEAIDWAEDGDLIQVAAGTYFEHIDFLGKAIEVGGMEPNDPNTGDLPVLYGLGHVPTVRMADEASGLGGVLRGMAVVGARGTQGGAIECIGGAPTLINCLVTGNYTREMTGGAVLAVDCNLLMMNCTIAHNTCGLLGGGIVLQNSQLQMLDSIVWGNTPTGILADANSVAVSQFSDLQTQVPGPGNITEDPLFVKSGAWVFPGFDFIILTADNDGSVWLPGDYHLKSQQGRWHEPMQTFVQDDSTSPCIDAGSDVAPTGQESDPNGQRLNQGVFGGTVFASQTHSESFNIPDENLKTAIMNALGIWWEPTEEDLMWVTTLYFELAETPERPTLWITDLTGLEAAVSLRSLNLRYHHVTDVSPLQNLTQLVKLDLSENELSDLSGLAALTRLGILDVHHNGVTDLTPLSGLRQLWSLTLRDNDYQGSLSALSSLTLLQHLDLEHNRIQELDDLRGLTRLTDLRLSYNEITDASALANMTELETLDLRHNLLNSVSALTGLTHLKKLFLEGNPLDSQALVDIQTIKDNNPGLDIDV